MTNTLPLAAALAVCLALPQLAGAEVIGAQLGYDYTALAERNMGGVNKSDLNGALDYALSPAFGVQGDMSMRFLDGTRKDSQGLTLHGYTRLGTGLSLGGFVGKEWFEGKGIENYGLEAAGQMNALSYEIAYTHTDGATSNGNMLSARGAYALNSQLSLGLRGDNFNGGGDNYKRLGGTVGYTLPSGMKMTGELGFVDLDGSPAESYVGIGLKASFGANGGTTFGRRGFIDALPGD